MRLLIVLAIYTLLSAQVIATKHRQVAPTGGGGGGGGGTVSLVGQGHGSSDTGVSSISLSTTSGTASSGGGSTLDIAAHDLIYVAVTIAGGNTCYSGGITVTASDTGTTNTFTSLGSQTNGYWGTACVYHLWADATARFGDTITVGFSSSAYTYGFINALVFRVSTPPASWAAIYSGTTDGGNSSSTATTLGSSGLAKDVLVAQGGLDSNQSATWVAGACANSVNCTIASTTTTPRSGVEYQILTASQTTVTAAISSTVTGGLTMSAALFRFTP